MPEHRQVVGMKMRVDGAACILLGSSVHDLPRQEQLTHRPVGALAVSRAQRQRAAHCSFDHADRAGAALPDQCPEVVPLLRGALVSEPPQRHLEKSFRIDLADAETLELYWLERRLHLRMDVPRFHRQRVAGTAKEIGGRPQVTALVQEDRHLANLRKEVGVEVATALATVSAAMLPASGSSSGISASSQPAIVSASRGAMYISARARRMVPSTLGCAQSSGRVGCSAQSASAGRGSPPGWRLISEGCISSPSWFGMLCAVLARSFT